MVPQQSNCQVPTVHLRTDSWGRWGNDCTGEKYHTGLGENKANISGGIIFSVCGWSCLHSCICHTTVKWDRRTKKGHTTKLRSPFYRHHLKFSFLAEIQNLRRPVQVPHTAVLRCSKEKLLIQMKFQNKTKIFQLACHHIVFLQLVDSK